MDGRLLIAMVVSLVVVALGGFYFALSHRTPQAAVVVAQQAAAPAAAPSAPVAAPAPPAAPAAPATAEKPKPATPESIEAEIAKTEHAKLQELLKTHFPDEYKKFIDAAVVRRNEGASDAALGEEAFARFQEIMRPKLKFAVSASTQSIDKLAANETSLFHALGTEGTEFCLKLLGKDQKPSTSPVPESVQRFMRLGTLYRFEAIVDGMAQKPTSDPLTPAEMGAFESSLSQDGMSFQEVRTGAFLAKQGDAPGKPCLMVEQLYRAIARLDDGTRRKLYSGMFFLGRD